MVMEVVVVVVVRGGGGIGLDGTTGIEEERGGEEDEVEEEHGDAEHLVHLPAETGDGQDDEAEHAEEQQDRARHAHTVDAHRFAVDGAVEKPRQRQPVRHM